MPPPVAPDALIHWLMIGLFLLQALWGMFLLVLSWSFRRVIKDIETNTAATLKTAEGITAINVLLAGHYINKPEFDRLDRKVDDLEKDIIRLQLYKEMKDRGLLQNKP